MHYLKSIVELITNSRTFKYIVYILFVPLPPLCPANDH